MFSRIRTFVLTATAIALVLLVAFPDLSNATTLQKGKVEVVSNPGARQTLKLRADFGVMTETSALTFTVQVINSAGVKVSEWQNVWWVRKGEYIVRGYDWQTKTIPDGKYVFAFGISKNGVPLTWNANAGSTVVAAYGWSFSSNAVQVADQVNVAGKFFAPTAAYGRYLLRVTVKDTNYKVVGQWTETAWLESGQTFELRRSVSLPAGRYSIDQDVWTENQEARLGSQERTSTFSVVAVTTTTSLTTTSSTTTIAPTTTTTAVPPTTVPSTVASTTTVPVTATTTAPAYNSTWTLVARDDFDGTTLDESKWATYSGIGNAGIGFRDPGNIRVGNGEVTMVGTTRNLTGAGMCWCSPNSATIYGRWEVRARMDKGNGFGPALLLWPESENWPIDGELDIAEIPNGDRTTMYSTSHWGADNSQIGAQATGDFSQWHTFGVDWQADHVTYFLDGKAIAHYTDPVTIPRTPMQLALQNDAGEGNSWIAAVDALSPAEVNLHIDWVKIYK